MKLRSAVIVVFIVLLICVQVSRINSTSRGKGTLAHTGNSQSLRLDIATNKPVYCLGERLQFSSRVTNVGHQTILLNKYLAYHFELFISVFDSIGKPVRFPWSDIRIDYDRGLPESQADFVSLMPGFFYGTNLQDDARPVSLLKPGKYTIKADLWFDKYPKDLGYQYWYGHLQSPRVEVIVVPVRRSRRRKHHE